jgi:hypothetical protein
MCDQTETKTGCWLLDLWRRTKTTSSIISPFRGEEEALDYLKHVDREAATHDGKPHRAFRQQWDHTTELQSSPHNHYGAPRHGNSKLL